MKQSTIKLLNKYVEENDDIFTTDGKELFCKLCNKSVSFNKKFLVEQHLRTQKHIDKYAEACNDEKDVLRDLLDKYALENSHVFETDGEVLFCKACNTLVTFRKKCLVNQHLKSQSHIENCDEYKETNLLSNEELLNKYVSENCDVYETDGKELFCKICKMSVAFDKKILIYQHSRTQKHIDLYKEIIKTDSDMLNIELLNQYVSENSEALETDGHELFCKICKKSIAFDSKYSVHRHLKSLKHIKISQETNNETKSEMQKSTAAKLLKKYISENSGVFETDGHILFCKVCRKSVSFNKKFAVDQHLKTQKHKDNLILGNAENLYGAEEDTIEESSIEWNTQKRKHNFIEIDEKYPNDTTTESFSAAEIPFSSELNEDLCRTCMKQFSTMKQIGEKQRITEVPKSCGKNASLMELLEIIQPQIKVEIKENLPTHMCSECIQKLLVSYEFIEMYRNVDKNLRKLMEEFDVSHSNKNSEEQQGFAEEMEVKYGFEDTKYEIEIVQLNVDDLQQQGNGIDRQCSEFDNEISGDDANFECAMGDGSDDDWIPKQSWLNVSPKKQNSDDSTNSSKIINEIKENSCQTAEHEDDRLQCPKCEFVFDTVKLMREHIRQNHAEKKTKRAYNKRTNEPRKKSTARIIKKIPSKQGGSYQCEYCEKRYSNYIFYRTHLRVHTVEPHLCIECGKSFARLSSFNTHMLRHKGEKKYQCPQCPKSFVCSSGLYGHMMVHTNNKPYVCDICGAAFHMGYQLRHHNLYHAGIKKFQCEYCDMRFVTREKQRRHMRTHTGEKPYRCKYCERAFAQSNDCVKHLRQHLGDNVYQCDLCPLRFPLVRDLRVHFATHKDDDAETRDRNLQARMEEERELQIRLSTKEPMQAVKSVA